MESAVSDLGSKDTRYQQGDYLKGKSTINDASVKDLELDLDTGDISIPNGCPC